MRLRPRDSSWTLTLVVGAAALAVAATLIGSRWFLSAERAVIPTERWPWQADGVGVEPDAAGSPFHVGDVVVAVDGRPLAAWAADALTPPWLLGAPQRPTQFEVLVIRDGEQVPVDAPLTGFPTDRIRGAPLGLLIYAVVALLLALVLIVRRPQATALRLLFVGVCCNTADILAWELGLQPSDLVLRTPFLYAFGLAAVGNIIFWSCLLHLLSIYPVRSPAIVRRPGIVAWFYVGPLAGLAGGAAVSAAAGGTALDWMARMASVVGAVASTMIVLILASIVAGYRRTPEARRGQVRAIAVALGIAATATLVLTTLPIALSGRPLIPRNTLALLAIPVVLAVALAVIRDRLFQVDVLATSRRRIVAAREEERRRLRRDLHDGLGPTLSALGLKIDAIRDQTDDQATIGRLDEVRTDLRAIVGQVRSIARELRPPTLDSLGLVGALRQALEGLADPMGPVIRLDDQMAKRGSALPAAVEVAAYRIVIEAATNVVRHADATTCVATLWIDDDELRIAIVDDGRGIGPGGSGVGTRSMVERAAEIGGELVIEPGRPQGTVIRASLPLGPAEALRDTSQIAAWFGPPDASDLAVPDSSAAGDGR
jgi:signal transduction histidine kinase